LADLKARVEHYSSPLKSLMSNILLMKNFEYDQITRSNDGVIEVHGCLCVPLQPAEGGNSDVNVRVPEQFDHLNDFHYLFEQFYSGVHSDTDQRSEPKPKNKWGAQTLWWEGHLPFAIVYSKEDNLEVFVHAYTVIENEWHRSTCHEQIVIKPAPRGEATR
jgi:hypothetical protein